ncbi:MAG TPA: SLBB domain-containing protein, partial [bacterium]|nr:SLBB domain-containing protein [bacterium]
MTTDDMLFPSGMDENAAADDLNGALTGRDQTDIKTYQTQQGMGFGNNFSAADILKDRGVWGEDMFKPREEQGGTSIEVDPEEYFVGPGDKITVMIWKEGRQPNSYQVVVSQQAEMYVPYLGRIDCEGRNLAAVSRSVQAMVGKKLPSFHSQVVLTKTRTSRVSVLGGVKQPGDYLVDIPSRVTDLIALAGGLGSNGSIRNIEITGKNGAKQKIDLFKFYQSGNRTFNPYVSNGQIIYVAIQRSLSEIKGEVFRPGKYEIIEGETLKKLLEFAGGPTSSADLKRVTLKRYLSVEGADVAGERAESS